MTDSESRLVVKRFPPGLHHRLRVLAAQQHTTISAIVIAAAERECDDREAWERQEAALREPGVIQIRRTGLGPFGGSGG